MIIICEYVRKRQQFFFLVIKVPSCNTCGENYIFPCDHTNKGITTLLGAVNLIYISENK